MKLKHLITKVFLVLLCFAMLTGVLAGCTVKEEDLNELQLLTEEVKKTADAAATADALAKAVAELKTVGATADAAATKEALAAAETALKALIESGDKADKEAIALLETAIAELKSGKADASALAAVKTELETKIAGIEAAVGKLDETYATDKAVAEAIAAAEESLKALVASGDAADQEAVNALETAINNLKSGKADISELNAVKSELNAKFDANSELIASLNGIIDKLDETYATDKALNDAKAELKALIDGNKAVIDALDGTYATDAALESAKNSLNDLITANADAISALNTAMSKLNDTYATDAELAAVKGLIDAELATLKTNATDIASKLSALETYSATKTELASAVSALETAAVGMKAELEAKVSALAEKVSEAETQANTNKTELAALKTEFAALTSKVDAISSKVTANESAIAALEDAVDAISKLEGTSKIVTDIKLIQEGLSNYATAEDLSATADAIKALIGTKTDAVAGSVWESLNKALADIESVKGGYATTEAVTTAIQNAKVELSDATTALETELKASLNSLSTALETLEGKHDSDISAINASISALQTSLEALEQTVASLQSEDFATAYNYASKVLMGVVAEIKEEDAGFSLKDFDEFIASVDEDVYEIDVYLTFKVAAEHERYYLNRALTVADIKASFERLSALKASLPTLLEAISDKISAIDGADPEISVTKPIVNTSEFETYINSIKTTYAKLTVEDQNTIQARYDAVCDAYDALLSAYTDAEAVIDEIELIDPDMIFGESESAVNAAVQSFETYRSTYFANAEVTKLYGADETAEKIVTNYETLAGYDATLKALAEANEIKPEEIELVLNYATVKPIFNQLTLLVNDDPESLGHKNAIDKWASDNSVNEANVKAMYTEEYIVNLGLAIEYATAMNNIYVTQDVEALVSVITGLCAEDHFVVYTDKASADECTTKLAEIKALVNAKVAEYASVNDGNYDAMVAPELLVKFTAVKERIETLLVAKGKFEELSASMIGVADVTPDKAVYDKIVGYKTTIDTYCTTYAITEGDANYAGFVQTVAEHQAALLNEYERVTAEIALLYKDIMAISETVESGGFLLPVGKTLITLSTELNKLTLELGVTNPDLVIVVDGDNVKLNELVDKCDEMIGEYAILATAAQSEAASLKAAIVSVGLLSADDIKNNATIKATMEDVVEWLVKYVGAETVENTYSQRLAEIDNTSIIGGNGTYVFMAASDYEAMAAHAAASDAKYSAAETAWETLGAALETLTSTWNIHSDFETPYADYAEYVAAYYANSIDDASELFEEWTTYQAFLTVYGFELDHSDPLYTDSYEYKKDAAIADAETIANAIKALDLAAVNAATASDVASIRTAVADYLANYNCEFLACEICGVTDDGITKADMNLLLEKAEAKSACMTKYDEFVAAYADELASGEYGVSQATLIGVLARLDDMLKGAALDEVDGIQTYFENQLINYENTIETNKAAAAA